MPCFHPITAFQPLEGGPILWRETSNTRQIILPCRQCVGCKLQYSAQWATRCMHESKTHALNSWATLTYADEHLPLRYNTGILHPRTGEPILSGSLHKPHMQSFYRRLRKALGRKRTSQILCATTDQPGPHSYGATPHAPAKPILRYYYAGEYGEKYHRPHYHACLFGIDFRDKILEKITATGYKLYTSRTLTKLWPHGNSLIGELTWESAAYTARYIMKKINGKQQQKHYERIDNETGEIINLCREFNDMSRKPGIGSPWLSKYMTDIYPHDYVIVRGHKTRPPRYYDKQYKAQYPDDYEQLKFGREIEAAANWENYTDERLLAEERITTRKIQSIKQNQL